MAKSGPYNCSTAKTLIFQPFTQVYKNPKQPQRTRTNTQTFLSMFESYWPFGGTSQTNCFVKQRSSIWGTLQSRGDLPMAKAACLRLTVCYECPPSIYWTFSPRGCEGPAMGHNTTGKTYRKTKNVWAPRGPKRAPTWSGVKGANAPPGVQAERIRWVWE